MNSYYIYFIILITTEIFLSSFKVIILTIIINLNKTNKFEKKNKSDFQILIHYFEKYSKSY